MKKISVIIPVYKVEKYLNACVSTVVKQTYKNLEIILIDDGSPDKCLQICDEWARKDERIKVIHQENKGLCAARNIGIDVATGEYIAFLDSDDYVDIRMYEFLYKAITEQNSDVAICYEIAVDEDKDLCEINTEVKDYTLLRNENKSEAIMHFIDKFTGYIGWTWNKLYKADLVKSTKFIEGAYLEDIVFNSQIMCKINKVTWISDRLYFYRQRLGSIMNSGNGKVFIDYGKALVSELTEFKPYLDEHQYDKLCSYCLAKIASLSYEARKSKLMNETKCLEDMFDKTYEATRQSAAKHKCSTKLFKKHKNVYYFLKNWYFSR